MKIIEELDKDVQQLFKRIVSYHFDEKTKSLPSAARVKQTRTWHEKYALEKMKSSKDEQC